LIFVKFYGGHGGPHRLDRRATTWPAGSVLGTPDLESGSLLSLFQSAHRTNHSTEPAILRVYSDLVGASDVGDISLMAQLDLSAAFDTVDHNVLLQRLKLDFGMSGSALS